MRPLHDPFAAGEGSNAEVRNHTARGLWPNTAYAFKVAASNKVGRSEYSEPGEFATGAVTPAVSAAVPLAGPSRGGTRVVLRGADLAFGSVYKCRFGDSVVPATRVESSLPVRAVTTLVSQWEAPPLRISTAGEAGSSIADGRATVACVSPRSPLMVAFSASGEPLQLSAAPVPLSVSPDGGTYTETSIHFTFYTEAEPASFSPTSGPLAGGTSIVVTGAFPRLLFANADAHSDAGSIAEAHAAAGFPEATCQFAGARVPARVLALEENATSDAEAALTLLSLIHI